MQNHYEVLGVRPDAFLAQIRAAYRKLISKHHPDKNPSPEAKARAQAINLAWHTLSDSIRRKLFDDFLKAQEPPKPEPAKEQPKPEPKPPPQQPKAEPPKQSYRESYGANYRHGKAEPPKAAARAYAAPKDQTDSGNVVILFFTIIIFIPVVLVFLTLVVDSKPKTKPVGIVMPPAQSAKEQIVLPPLLPRPASAPVRKPAVTTQDPPNLPKPIEVEVAVEVVPPSQPIKGLSCVELWQAYKGKSAPKSFYISRDYRHCGFASGGEEPDTRAWKNCINRSELGACQLVEKVER